MITASFKFKQWTFPGGEVGVQITEEVVVNPAIMWRVEPTTMHSEFFAIVNLIDACNKLGKKPCVTIPYLPYARQDRVCNPGESFALEVLIKMLFQFNAVFVFYDLHSDKVNEICDETFPNVHFRNIKQKYCFDSLRVIAGLEADYDFVVAPDAGAKYKATELRDHCLPDAKLICMQKVRTENAVEYRTDAEELSMQNPKILVVDDICDGGATFIALAETLKKSNPSAELHLYVTHGLFSKGTQELEKHYTQIMCYNLINKNASAISAI